MHVYYHIYTQKILPSPPVNVTAYQELQHLKQACKVFLKIIWKRSKHPFQVYRIIHLLPLNPPYTEVPKLPLHKMKLTYLKGQPSVLHQI